MAIHRVRLIQTVRVIRDIVLTVEADGMDEAIELAADGDFPDGEYTIQDSEVIGWVYIAA